MLTDAWALAPAAELDRRLLWAALVWAQWTPVAMHPLYGYA